jgi:hypothetical protein
LALAAALKTTVTNRLSFVAQYIYIIEIAWLIWNRWLIEEETLTEGTEAVRAFSVDLNPRSKMDLWLDIG